MTVIMKIEDEVEDIQRREKSPIGSPNERDKSENLFTNSYVSSLYDTFHTI